MGETEQAFAGWSPSTVSVGSRDASSAAPAGVELRHLRYFVAVADAGSFTHAAERMYIAQPTLSQQIRRLEEMVGTPLLRRKREGVLLTEAGSILLEESRTLLSLIDHAVGRTRQVVGLGRPRLRFVVPPLLPESLAVGAASRLRSTAAVAGVDIAWMETALDTEFSLIRQRRADAGLGWMSTTPEALPEPLDVMSLGDFEPLAWLPASHPATATGFIAVDELAGMDVAHSARPGSSDPWLAVLRAANPDFTFLDPPFRRSLPMTLAFAAASSRPTAVLTGPFLPVEGALPGMPGAATYDMVPVRVAKHELRMTSCLVWNGDLPRQLQQVLFDTADGITAGPGCSCLFRSEWQGGHGERVCVATSVG